MSRPTIDLKNELEKLNGAFKTFQSVGSYRIPKIKTASNANDTSTQKVVSDQLPDSELNVPAESRNSKPDGVSWRAEALAVASSLSETVEATRPGRKKLNSKATTGDMRKSDGEDANTRETRIVGSQMPAMRKDVQHDENHHPGITQTAAADIIPDFAGARECAHTVNADMPSGEDESLFKLSSEGFKDGNEIFRLAFIFIMSMIIQHFHLFGEWHFWQTTCFCCCFCCCSRTYRIIQPRLVIKFHICILQVHERLGELY
jgi:hypothetical protein